jgi:hypothetical protein
VNSAFKCFASPRVLGKQLDLFFRGCDSLLSPLFNLTIQLVSKTEMSLVITQLK